MFNKFFSENRTVYQIIRKNMVETDRSEMTVQYGTETDRSEMTVQYGTETDRSEMTVQYGTERMRLVSRITKARTQTHTNIGYANAPQCYVISKLSFFFFCIRFVLEFCYSSVLFFNLLFFSVPHCIFIFLSYFSVCLLSSISNFLLFVSFHLISQCSRSANGHVSF